MLNDSEKNMKNYAYMNDIKNLSKENINYLSYFIFSLLNFIWFVSNHHFCLSFTFFEQSNLSIFPFLPAFHPMVKHTL